VNTNSTSSFLLSKRLGKRFYIDNGTLDFLTIAPASKSFLPSRSLKELLLIVQLHAGRPCFIAGAQVELATCPES